MTLGDWLTVAALGVSTVGFAVTIWQLMRTANATEATAAAVMRTEKRMALNHLLVLLPQFRLIELDLDNAAEDDDRKLAIRALVAFSHTASEVAGLLRNQPGTDAELTQQLQDLARLAAETKAAIIDDPRQPAKSITKEFRGQSAQLSSHMGGLVSRFTLEVGA